MSATRLMMPGRIARLAALLKTIDEQHSDIDLLVNAAGVFFPKPFLEHQDADYDQYMKLNKAFFFITQKVAANLVAKDRPGAIVNIGSMWAKQAIAATPSSAYSMAKAGLHSLTQHLAMELAPKHIRVNAVSPAVVQTPIYEGFIPKTEVHSALQSFKLPPDRPCRHAEDAGDVLDLEALQQLPPDRPCRHPTGRCRSHHFPALGQGELGHRRGLGRGRWRDGRPQLMHRGQVPRACSRLRLFHSTTHKEKDTWSTEA